MPLTAVSIRRPLTMIMLIFGMMVIGYRSYNEMKLDRFPTVDFPVVSVSVIWPGASPEDVEDQIVIKIEDAVARIAGIDTISSRAGEGYGAVTIEFQDGTDGNAAAVDVQRQVATITDFPDGAEDAQILKFDINATPIVELILSGPQSQDVLFDLADNLIKDQLQSVPGVSSVSIAGGREREIQVNINPERLAAYNLTLGQVQQTLAANNITIPAGTVELGNNKMTVRSVGEFETMEEIRNLIVSGSLKAEDGESSQGLVYMRDIATVADSYKDRETILRFNGRDAVNLSVIKSSDANTVELADTVLERIGPVNEKLPAGASLEVVVDDSKFIRESVEAVQEDLMAAVIITGLVVLIFLHTLRNAFIVLMCLPTAIISNFTVMWLFGFTLDGITLLALTLVIGILVDDSIVMVENIERHAVELKEPPKVAAYRGASEIALAVLSMTLVMVVIYLPVAFISGIIGQFFFSYGITIASSTLFSMFVAFTLTPLLSAYLLEDHSKPQPEPTGLRKYVGKFVGYTIGFVWNSFIRLFEYGFSLLGKLYALTLKFFLHNPLTQFLAITIAASAFGFGLWLVGSGLVGAEFLPAEDEGKVILNITMPPGTKLDETNEVARQLEQIILQEVPEAIGILTNLGTSEGGGGAGANVSSAGRLTVLLTDKSQRTRGDEQIVDELRPVVQKIPDATISLLAGEGGGPGGAAIVVRLSGPDKNELIRLSQEVEAVMRTVPNTTDISNQDALQSPETRFVIDRDKARDLGLSPQMIAGTLRTALSGSKAGDFTPLGSTKVDLTIRADQESRETVDKLLAIPISYSEGASIILEQVVKIETELAAASIKRFNRQLVLDVSSGVTGRAVGDVTNDVEAAINEQVQFPLGYGFEFSGSAEFQRDAFSDMIQALGMAIILIYILLVALYQSFLQPLAIMFSLPVSLVGAFGGLYITGNSLSLISILGIILLTGVVTKNAILLVDFTNTLREDEGLPVKDALVKAGRMRLRAIFMTSFSLIFALLPLLLGQSAGSETRAPMAAVVIGGLLSSTFLTLILVPVVYNFFDFTSSTTSRVLGFLWGTQEVPQGSSPEQVPPKTQEPLPESDPQPENQEDPAPKRDPKARPQTGAMPQPGSAITLNPGSDTA